MSGAARVQIYGLTDSDGNIRYVGKAVSADRRLKGHLRETRRRTPLYDWIARLRQDGVVPGLVILAECGTDEWEAEERRHIAWGRAMGLRILNLAHGGDQPVCSPATRLENARRLNARLASDEAASRLRTIKRDLAVALRRGHVSEATKAKMRAAGTARPDLFGDWAHIT